MLGFIAGVRLVRVSLDITATGGIVALSMDDDVKYAGVGFERVFFRCRKVEIIEQCSFDAISTECSSRGL